MGEAGLLCQDPPNGCGTSERPGRRRPGTLSQRGAPCGQGYPGFEVIAEAKSGEEALEKVDLLKPDLVLMDINMPGIGGSQRLGG